MTGLSHHWKGAREQCEDNKCDEKKRSTVQTRWLRLFVVVDAASNHCTYARLLLMPVLARRLFGGIDPSGNFLLVLCISSPDIYS